MPRKASHINTMLMSTPNQNCHFFMRRIVTWLKLATSFKLVSYAGMEEIMSKLPWWLNLLVKIMVVDLVIALFALGWSWLTKDSSLISLSNRFFLGGAVAIL